MSEQNRTEPHGWLNTETLKTRVGEFEFKNGYPTDDTAQRLRDLQTLNRATEVYLTQIMRMGETAWREGMRAFGSVTPQQVVIWEGLLDPESLLLTSNAETVYAVTHLCLQNDGPTVVEAPPKMLGFLMDGLQRYLEKEVEGVGRTLSLVEYIKNMNRVMFAGDMREYRIPENDQTIAEYLFLYSLTAFPGDFDPVVSPDYKYANIKVDVKDHKSATINALIEKTETWIQNNHRSSDISFAYAGGNIGMLAAVNQIVKPMLSGNSVLTSALVFFCLVAAYGFVAGWLLFLPLIFRTLLVFGILGFLKIGLTCELIPVVALGIGFGDDFGIYILSRLMDEMKESGGNLKNALVKSMATSGKAVFFTGLTLTIGIATWMFSDILMQARLGALLAFFIFFNAIGTLIVMPSMIMTVRPRFLTRISEMPSGEHASLPASGLRAAM